MPLYKTWEIENATWGVWQITEPLDFFTSQMQADCFKEIASIPHEEKRRESYCGRFLLATIGMGQQVNQLKKTKEGKPYIPNLDRGISISHTPYFTAALISHSLKCGIDIERIHPRVQKIAARFLHASELKMSQSDITCMNLFWSAKETIYKWHGEGALSFQEQIRILEKSGTENEGTLYCCLILPDISIDLKIGYWVFEHHVLTVLH